MQKRFERLFQLPNNQYTEGSPVILVAGALLKDTATENIISQLKFQSVSKKKIVALKLSLAAYDVSGIELQGVSNYQYLELNIDNGQQFGGNKAIVLPSSIARSFSVTSVVVVFQDGTTWESSTLFAALSNAKSLKSVLNEQELEKQYRISTNDNAKYEPLKEKGLWHCACGTWNGGDICTACQIYKDKVFSAFNISSLQAAAEKRIAEEKTKIAMEQEQRRVAIAKELARKEERNKKYKYYIKRIAIIGSALVIALITIGIIAHIIIKSYSTDSGSSNEQPELTPYEQALAYVEEEKYEEAYEILWDIKKRNKKEEELFSRFSFVKTKFEVVDGRSETYIYDKEGILILKETKENDGEERTWECTYDKKGRLILEEAQLSDGSKNSYSYTYDKNGFLLTEFYEFNDGSWMKHEYTNDANGNPIKMRRTTSFDYWLNESYTYNEHGDYLITTSSDPYSSRVYRYTYTYDENGNILTENRSSNSGDWIEDIYTYDKYGNNIAKDSTSSDGEQTHIKYEYELRYCPEA